MCVCDCLSVSVSVDYITVFFIEDNMYMQHGADSGSLQVFYLFATSRVGRLIYDRKNDDSPNAYIPTHTHRNIHTGLDTHMALTQRWS